MNFHFFRDYFPECEECLEPSLSLFCEKCLSKLRFQKACVSCGRLGLHESMNACGPCMKRKFAWEFLAAALFYEGGVRRWIQDIKDHRKPERLKELVAEMLPALPQVDFVVSVASDPMRDRDRGYSFSRILSQRVSELLKRPALENVFYRKNFLTSQKELDEIQRRRFFKNLVSLNPQTIKSLRGAKILLVDDIMTTGASLERHALLLKQAGSRVYAFCIARTPRYF